MQKEELQQAVEAANSSNNVYVRIEAKVDAIAQFILEDAGPAASDIDLAQLAKDVEDLSKAVNGEELTEEEANAVDADFEERVRAIVFESTGIGDPHLAGMLGEESQNILKRLGALEEAVAAMSTPAEPAPKAAPPEPKHTRASRQVGG